MRRILLIQSRTSAERLNAEQACYLRAIGGAAECHFESTLDVEKDWESPARIVAGYDAVVLGGSSDFFLHGGKGEGETERIGAREVLDRVRSLVEYVLDSGMPFLGVCFGHQLVAEIRGGGVTHDHAQKKFGTYAVTLTDAGRDDALFARLPDRFHAQYAHRDSVTALPRGSTLIGTGNACRFAALRYGERAYTFQFHPELLPDDLREAPGAVSLYLDPEIPIESVLAESPEAASIIPHFVSLLG